MSHHYYASDLIREKHVTKDGYTFYACTSPGVGPGDVLLVQHAGYAMAFRRVGPEIPQGGWLLDNEGAKNWPLLSDPDGWIPVEGLQYGITKSTERPGSDMLHRNGNPASWMATQ